MEHHKKYFNKKEPNLNVDYDIEGFAKRKECHRIAIEKYNNGCFYYKHVLQLDEFLNIIIDGNYYNKEIILNAVKNSVLNADGTCGAKVHKNIRDSILQ